MQAAFGIRLNQNKRAVGLLNGNALCYGLPPQARVWRRNAMNTAEHLCLNGKKAACRIDGVPNHFAVNMRAIECRLLLDYANPFRRRIPNTKAACTLKNPPFATAAAPNPL